MQSFRTTAQIWPGVVREGVMRLRAVAFAVFATVFCHSAALSSDIGKKFITEYRKTFPGEQWELVGRTVETAKTVRVYFRRVSESSLRMTVCTRLQKASNWVCETGQNLPEGSLVIK